MSKQKRIPIIRNVELPELKLGMQPKRKSILSGYRYTNPLMPKGLPNLNNTLLPTKN